ncbi:MAG: DUF4173 domain-containing protein [Turicibacter sp.]|nr:DUF4173 domain-containing protein [Turicibacter sp.]
MESRVRKTYNYLLQAGSAAFGFFLMLGLSIDKTWASYFVVVLIIIMLVAETIWLKKIKELNVVHHLESNWILLAGAVAYVLTNSVIVKISMLLVMILSAYITLYRECYYERISFRYIKSILGDLPILCLYHIMDFFKRDEPVKNRIQRYKLVNGICILFIVLVCIFFPLYAAVDDRVEAILYFIIIKLISVLPIWGVCALLGMIPAMINYSIVQGLVLDIVLDNPERNYVDSFEVSSDNLYFNEVIVKVVLWGLVIVNAVFIGLQVSYLFHLQESQKNIESLYHLSGIFPLLAAIGTSIIFAVISEYVIIKCEGTEEVSRITYLYILSLIALLLLVGYRYVLKVINYGIGNLDMIIIISILLLAIVLVTVLHNVIVKGKEILYKLAIWGTVGFVILSILPWEYFAAKINVSVFSRRYQNGEFIDKVTEQDINLDFLKQMKYDAVPALVSLIDIPLTYEETNKSLGESAKEIVVHLFYMDMTDEEISEIGELETNKEIKRFQDILAGKIEYCVIGKRKMAYKAFCEALEKN